MLFVAEHHVPAERGPVLVLLKRSGVDRLVAAVEVLHVLLAELEDVLGVQPDELDLHVPADRLLQDSDVGLVGELLKLALTFLTR